MNRFFASVLVSTALSTAAVAQTAPTDSVTPLRRCVTHWVASKPTELTISLGFNALTGSGTPAIRPLGSRYIAVGYLTRLRLIEGPKVGLTLRTGLEVSWYNFMLDDNRVAVQTPAGITFPEAVQPLVKSKLTAAYLNLPLMPTFVFRHGMIRSVSAGGYVGMRLDSYVKTKAENGTKDRDHGSYSLTNVRYGLGAEIAFRHAPTFFAQYDLNPMFRAGQGPAGQGVSFGIRL